VITVVVGLDPSGNLVFAEASGHAGTGKRGADIVCAAATAILRTTMEALAAGPSGASGISSPQDSKSEGPAIEATTAGRGDLSFRVTAFSGKDEPFLRYAACFLREGMASLEREYPEAVTLRIEEVDRVRNAK
jgi:uncharacterized protein YsxB (DUF464 family)